ncbi:signal peptidase II [Clostridium cylindrosporum]|uniref:Lipoprotein signal peptidase n=1 Tax=Clostridium cylindrosporum DSM 605 TaxID=1121307 RepID=A0A0J8DAW3_CLOCY|nr:signal peptidase II [Clostridium cylindrosporum]KMT21438.1 lipoprotein signal peptidase LspA [Clostridium cylindrosporum DSM 605]
MFNALFILGIILLDQFSKYMAKFFFEGGNDKVLIEGMFSLTYLENRGAAFGIFKDQKFILIGLTAIVIISLIVYLYRHKKITKLLRISLILIIGGAVGNLIDRIYLGYVVDFFHFYIKDIFDWPVFNIADISVVCGTTLMAIAILFSKED